MGTRAIGKLLRGAAAAAMTAALAFTLTACGGGDDEAPNAGSSAQPSGRGGDGGSDGRQDGSGGENGGEDGGEGTALATIKGSDGVNIVVTSVVRDQGGFVTVKGRIENTGDQVYAFRHWTAGDTELASKGASVGGMTLVDKKGKKRYYILRDTDDNCLCTMFPSGLGGGKTADFFAQFPAPPAETTEVDLQVPTMSSVTVQITDK
ncbi:hypothetical protein CUT44_16395 [Streptomyces carminius]|uniref:Secreted protein n=1 Tax=Streptomyces carminius TaxID=2665496 RepID=A0A2M8LXG1_9ACTN|nr:hypothetical protein [Streptomyces carminius]PJE96625.1 hypothetical protein CUT44_16395 [Streptomyces carminius]